jgi:hypothetical protein
MVNLLRRKSTPDEPVPVRPLDQRDAFKAAVTAAVSQVRMDGAGWKQWKFGDRAWQADAWRLYDITGQLRFVANWVGNCVSRCRLTVKELDEDGEPTIDVTDPAIADLAKGPLGTGAAKDEALRLLGINLFVPGEGFIVAEADGNGDGSDRWFVASGSQVKRKGDKITIKRSQLQGSGVMEYREGTDLILRVWTPHPRDTDEPDSPTRSAIPDLREIEANRKRVFAEMDSRLAGAGVLTLPEGIDFPRRPGEAADPAGFATVLMRTMGTSLTDRESAEAMVPIIVQGKGEELDKIKHITFWSELSDQLLPLRNAAITSLAQSLDVPPEVLLGLGSSNHWSAWAISEDAVTTQIVPVLARIADALTIGYLRAALETMGVDGEKYVYAFDTSPLTTRSNRVSDGLSYHERGLISDVAARQAGAFSDDDKPDPEETVRRLVARAVEANPLLITDPVVAEILGIPAITAPAGPAIEGTTGGGDGDGGDGEQGTPDTQPGNGDNPPAQDADTAPPDAALFPAVNQAVRHALAMAGKRLVPHTRRDRYPGTAAHALHVERGPVSRADALAALRNAWADLPALADDLMIDAGQLEELLSGFCLELLTRGMAYDPALLREVMRRAQGPAQARLPVGAVR